MPNKKVPKPASALKKNRFEFDLDIDGELRTYSLPQLGFLNRKVKKKMRLLPSIPDPDADGQTQEDYAAGVDSFYDSIVEILEAADPRLGEVADDLENTQIDWIIENWQAASGLSVGESETSSS